MTTFIPTAILTKLIANPAQPQVRQDLRDIQRMHHVLTSLACRPEFGPSSRAGAGLLYRVEQNASGVQILMQSATRPDPERLAAGYDIAGSADLGPLLDRLDAGVAVRYRITANPTKSSSRGPGQRGELRPLHSEEALHWWERKATDSGMQIEKVECVATGKLSGSRSKDRRPSRLAITTATFEGTALVREPGTLRNAIHTGIGRGRAYGCGLLSLAPLTRPATD